MTAEPAAESHAVQYEPDDSCPPYLVLGVAAQGVMLVTAPIVMFATVAVRAGGQDDYVPWAVFATLVITGALTALQASRIPRFGAGHILIVGPTLNFTAISALALATGGPQLLASLVVSASPFYLILAFWLPLLRRIITSVVSGTALMLISLSILSITVGRIRDIPDSAPEAAGPLIALAALIVLAATSLRLPRRWRPWSPLMAVAAGWLVAAPLGAYDISAVIDAPWIGLPAGRLPGFELGFGLDFWALLPAFVVVTLVGGVENVADSVAIQQVSRRLPKATDFRLVQNSLNTNGLGILFAGIVGTPPTSVYSSYSVSLIDFTSVAVRRVGYTIGAALLLLALSPKVTAAFISIPDPVMGAVVVAAAAELFLSGIRILAKDGLDARKALVASMGFATGFSLDSQAIFTSLAGERWGQLLDNGVVIGTATTIVLTLFIEVVSPMRQARVEVDLSVRSLPTIDSFLCEVASKVRWNEASSAMLRSAGEETLLSLIDTSDVEAGEAPARCIVNARPGDDLVELEFLAVFDDENLQDRLAHLSDEVETTQGVETEISLRLLRHYASSVQHQKFYGLDVVTVVIRRSR